MGPWELEVRNWKLDWIVKITPRHHTLFWILYTPGLHILFCKPLGWINVFNSIDRESFL